MTVLLVNSILYLAYFIVSYKRCPYFTVHNAMSLWFFIVSFMGVVAVHTGLYQAIFGKIHIDDFTPYFYCFLSFLFLVYPLRKLNYKYITIGYIDEVKYQKFRSVSYLPLVILLVYILALIPDVVIALTMSDISEVYDELRKSGADLYEHPSYIEKIFWIARKVYNWFWAIFVFYSIYCLNKPNAKSKKYFIILFIASLLPYFLRTITTGGRGGFVFFPIQIALVLLPLWSSLSHKTKKSIYKYSLFAIGLFAIYIGAMTIARFSDSQSETPMTSIIRYFGEPYPNLGNNLYGHVSKYLMGRRMFPELFGYNYDNMTQYDLFGVWQSYCGVGVLNYKTIFGDFYIEFGTEYALLIIFLIGFLMNMYLDNGILYFHQVPVYAYYMTICSTAPLWFNQRNTGDILVVVQLLIVSYFIKKFLYIRKKT